MRRSLVNVAIHYGVKIVHRINRLRVLTGAEDDMRNSQVVVVTGAAAGLGRAIAHGVARRGASVGLLARNPEALEAARQECEALGGRAMVLPVDVQMRKQSMQRRVK